MNCETAVLIDDYLIDNEISPKPISELVDEWPDFYFKQIIECARHWSTKERLAVGSMIVNQPLKAMGATDTEFILSDNPDREFMRMEVTWFGLRLNETSDTHLVILVEGDFSADVNSPARHAGERAVARGLKIDEQFVHLYEYIRQVASDGFCLNLNKIAMDTDMDKEALRTLRSAEYELIRKAVNALNKFEGIDLFQSDSNTLIDCIAESPRGLPNNDEVRSASHLGVRGDE